METITEKLKKALRGYEFLHHMLAEEDNKYSEQPGYEEAYENVTNNKRQLKDALKAMGESCD